MDERDEQGVIPAWEGQELLRRAEAQARQVAQDLLRALVEVGAIDEQQDAAWHVLHGLWQAPNLPGGPVGVEDAARPRPNGNGGVEGTPHQPHGHRRGDDASSIVDDEDLAWTEQ